jgi:hypothetical protein
MAWIDCTAAVNVQLVLLMLQQAPQLLYCLRPAVWGHGVSCSCQGGNTFRQGQPLQYLLLQLYCLLQDRHVQQGVDRLQYMVEVLGQLQYNLLQQSHHRVVDWQVKRLQYKRPAAAAAAAAGTNRPAYGTGWVQPLLAPPPLQLQYRL